MPVAPVEIAPMVFQVARQRDKANAAAVQDRPLGHDGVVRGWEKRLRDVQGQQMAGVGRHFRADQ